MKDPNVIERESGAYRISDEENIIEPRQVFIMLPNDPIYKTFAGKTVTGFVFHERETLQFPLWCDFAHEGGFRSVLAQRTWVIPHPAAQTKPAKKKAK